MASSGKTPRLELSLWEESDKPKREDFRGDNEKLEEKVGGHMEDATLHLDEARRTFLEEPYVLYGYQGNGTSTRTLTLPFAPAAVFIYNTGRPLGYYYSGRIHCTAGFSWQGENSSTSGVKLNGAEMTVREVQETVMAYTHLNDSGFNYKVVLFR